jgi:putative hemolysin
MGIAAGLLAIFALIAAGAFFVIAEYALVTSRRSTLAERAERGSRGARTALRMMDDPVRIMGTVQIAITGLGILLGAVGEGVMREILDPLLAAPVAFVGAFTIVTYLSVAFGELLPKALALRSPEPIAIFVSRPIDLLSRLFKPAVWILQASAGLLLRPLGIRSVTAGERPVNREELRAMLQEAEEHGTLRPDEEDMLSGVIDLRSREARDVMLPWEEVVWIDVEQDVDELVEVVRSSPHTRYPAVRGAGGTVVGVLHARDVWRASATGEVADAAELAREPVIVPPTVRLDGLLRQMRRARQHLAIVLGEYGTPVGIVSMEDIVEEIVGEIEDELDDGRTRVTRQSDGSFTADGRVSLTDFNRVAGTELPSEHAHSVGGLIFDELGRAPEKGDVVQVDGAHLEVLEVDGHRIDRVRVRL